MYVDASTLGSGPATQRRAWFLRLLRTPDVTSRGTARSQRILYVINCPAARLAVRAILAYASADGSGPVQWSLHNEDHQLTYIDVVPGTFSESLMSIACRQ